MGPVIIALCVGCLARLEGLHGHASDPAVVVVLVACFPKLAVAVDVVAKHHLLAHHLSNTSLGQLIKGCLVASGTGVLDLRDIAGIWQPPRVRGEDPFRATLHSPLLLLCETAEGAVCGVSRTDATTSYPKLIVLSK
jgi:hypothetical protein